MGMWILNPWTAREVPIVFLKCICFLTSESGENLIYVIHHVLIGPIILGDSIVFKCAGFLFLNLDLPLSVFILSTSLKLCLSFLNIRWR